MPTVDAQLALLPWPVGLFSTEGKLLSANPPFARMVRATGGRQGTVTAPELFGTQTQVLQALYRALAGERPPSLVLASAGNGQAYRVHVRPLPDADGAGGALLYAEAVPAKRASQGARERRRQVLDAALDRITSVIFTTPDHDAILDGVVSAVVETGVADSAIIYLRHEHKWHIRHLCGLPAELKGREMEQRELKASLRAMEEKRVVVINDTEASEEVTEEWVERFGIKALIDTEIEVMAGELADFAVHNHDRKRPFDDQDVTFMERLAASVTLALRNARLVTSLQQERQIANARRERLTRDKALGDALNRINELIHSTLDFDEIMQRVIVETAKAVGAESAVIYVREARGCGWVARYTYGRLAAIQGQCLSDDALGDSIGAIGEGRAILINDARADHRVNRDLVEQYGVRAVLDIGLRVADGAIGDFGLYYHTPAKSFTESEQAFMDKVGASVGLALQNANRITQLSEIQAALRKSEVRFRTLADNISQLTWMADASGSRFWFNRRWFEYTGTTPEEVQGSCWQKVHHPDHLPRALEMFRHALEAAVPMEGTFPLRGRDGSYRWFLTRAMPIRDEHGHVVRWFGTDTDITERMQAEERERHQARHDPLTDLPNRRLLLELLQAELLKAQRSERKLAVLFLDLDRFKVINDTLGHGAGDALLQAVAKRLAARVRRSDIVARLGGDEFTVLLPDLQQEEQAREVAANILEVFHRPFEVSGQHLYVTTSIGISLYPDDDDSAEGLLRRADLGMYEAKEQGRNTYRFYNPVVDRRAQERAHIETGLRHALEHDGLRVVYQPKFDLHSGKMVGLESLVRWQHPELGLLEPERFIPVAEESDLIIALDDWVLSRACAQAKRWLDKGLSPVCVSVNLSAKRFERADVVEAVRNNLAKTGLDPRYLELELTEGTVMRHIEQSIERMQELVALGVRIAVDDFGTGYSSLSYLKRLPISKLKIDQSFVRDIGTDPDDRAIVQAVTTLAHALGKRVIAEGVETEVQRSFLDASGCEQAQGYLFAQPLPAEQVSLWLG